MMKPISTSIFPWPSRTRVFGPLKVTLWKRQSVLRNAACALQSASKNLLYKSLWRQLYLQQLQDEVIPVIQTAGHVDTTYFQENGARLHKTSVILDVLHGVFGSHALLNRFTECFGCGWSWPPYLPDNPEIIFLGATSRIVRTAPTFNLFRRWQAKIEADAEGITCNMLREQLKTLRYIHRESTRSQNIVLKILTWKLHAQLSTRLSFHSRII